LIELRNDVKQFLDWVEKREKILKQFRLLADSVGPEKSPLEQLEKMGKTLNETTNSLLK